MTTIQTWTRKENAFKAVNKLMTAAGVDYPSSRIEVGEHADGGFYAKVYAKTAFLKETSEAIGQKAFVFACEDEAPAEQPEPVTEEAPAPKAPKASSKASRKIFINGDKNPFRAGNGAWKTFEHVRANPGITFEELKTAPGIRMRAVSGCLQMDWFKVGE
jgi:hypothetical protein